VSLVAAERVDVVLGGRRVLHGIDLAVDEGEIVTLLGPNGSGKSTLLRTLLGAVPASAGTVRRRDRLAVGYVPQTLAIDATLPISVGRFLDLPVRAPRSARHAALARVGAHGLERRAMTKLSGGQFQRVLLARALLARPELLMLDEPTHSLDHAGAAAFYGLIDEVRRETGCGVLMVSHDLHGAMRISDRVVCLEGCIRCEGVPHEVAAAPAYRALFGETAGALARDHHPLADGV